jgi:hypothetical protein
MMSIYQRIGNIFKAWNELGTQALVLYAWHQFSLRIGLLRIQTPSDVGPDDPRIELWDGDLRLVLPTPDRNALAVTLGEGTSALLAESDEILGEQVRLFGGPPRQLGLENPGPLVHWTDYRTNLIDGIDIKWFWEPARFGWATVLARVYHLTKDEKYAHAFWTLTERFLEANPPNLGLNWVSAQEVSLRLIHLVFALCVFIRADSTTPARKNRLVSTLQEHAKRIPPTLTYARAQNNNHLLVEATGLYSAGVAFPDHPKAKYWRDLGWRWLNHALQTQIDDEGGYVQNSTNYHRMMLQTALWVGAVSTRHGDTFPEKTQMRLASATRWLLSMVDERTGRVPNLGPNDGAFIFPLSVCPFQDYRPVLQAASLAFLGEPAFPAGVWDEMAFWLVTEEKSHQQGAGGGHRRLVVGDSWGTLRAARFRDRPGHADQLHFELWWRGLNLACDAGTFLYNATPPWDNALSGTSVHNTIRVDGCDQMSRAGPFLWLDWAQAEVIEERLDERGKLKGVVAQHDGYRKMGVVHQRTVEVDERERWMITDRVLQAAQKREESPREIRLHWLLPDWEWDLEQTTLKIKSPYGWVTLSVGSPVGNQHELHVRLVRAGEVLHGRGPVSPVQGWVSPSYGQKVPALSFAITIKGALPLVLTSVWRFPE